MIREIDSGRLETIISRREIDGKLIADETFISLEGFEYFTEVFDLDCGDLWEDYRDREGMITQLALAAAEAARIKAEASDDIEAFSGRIGGDLSALPEWAQVEILRFSAAAGVSRKQLHVNHERSPNTREMRSLLNVVGCLVETCLGQSPGKQKYSIFDSQTSLIDTLVSRYPGLYGLSQRKLEGLFPKARKALKQE